ncbi:hypothetical protein [Helicobacter sp. MIT 14-3879]|nr:hypothetical protein [Helicobacter sp. MIT 14-3879]
MKEYRLESGFSRRYKRDEESGEVVAMGILKTMDSKKSLGC